MQNLYTRMQKKIYKLLQVTNIRAMQPVIGVPREVSQGQRKYVKCSGNCGGD